MPATEARASLGLPADAPVVLFFGMMRPYKGLDYLLQAFAQVRRELPDARLLLAGRAPAGFDAIQRQIARLGLTDSTVALARYLPLRELARCFLASDVVALPYVEASQSGVLHLAYAFRRPVVATRVGGLPAVIEDGATGLLVPPRDADALAAALRQALADRGQCHRWGERAFAFGEAIGSWREIAARTIEVYQRCTYGPSGD